MENLSGKAFHGYELKEQIGSGGFGAVYRARQPAVDREVAVKVILPQFAEHPDFVARFEAEARTIAKLEHPHIVPLYDYWHDEGGAFLVMRYLKGGSLRERLEAAGALDLEDVGRILEQVCEALGAAHDQGVIHRDLKPENILLDERGQAYLTDFGIAKDLGGESLTRTGMLIGSAAYLAPEQAKREKVSPQTDIYGLGIMLFELLTGEHPFPDQDPVQLVQSHLTQPLPPIRSKRADLPSTLDALIQQATAKIPGHRYSGVIALHEQLQRIVEGRRDHAPAEIPLPRPAFLEGETQPEPEPTFVGREPELARLETLLKGALEGRGKVGLLIGGAGQGKTALAHAFARRALNVHDHLLAAYGDCNAQSGIGDPYLPFREALEMLGGEVESAWSTGRLSTEGARRLWSAAPATVQAILEMGPDLVDLFIPGSMLKAAAAATAPQAAERVAELEAFLERKAIFSATSSLKQIDLFEQFTRVLRKLSEHSPLLLVLDDFQWADDASTSLLFHLSRRIGDRPILLLCAYRPDEVAQGRDGDRHPLEQVANEVKRIHGEVVIDLAQSEEGMGFIDAFLDSEPNALGPAFRQALFDHTGGHPLFTVELLRAMQERGEIRQDHQGRWVEGGQLAWDQLPARVEAVIEERIARLESEIRELLSVASVEGNDFTAQVLARIQQVEERRLLRQLSQELQKRHRLIRDLGEVRSGRRMLSRFQFAHHLFQRYLYNGLSAAERRLLHGEITEALEEIFADDTESMAVQLAYHSRRAGLEDKAIHYLRLAGDQARARYANQEAVRYYTELLEALPPSTRQRFSALAARAAVYDLVANRDAQLGDAEQMLSIAKALGDDALLMDAHLARADAHIESEHLLAIEPAERALELARKLGDPVREAGALRRLGWSSWLKCDYAVSRDRLEAAVALFRGADLPNEAAACFHILSLAHGAMYEHTAAMEAAREAVELSRRVGDRRQEATSLRRVAIAHMAQDQYQQALPIAEKALALHREVGDWSEEAHALNVLGVVYGWLDRWEESEGSLRRSLAIGHDLRSTTAIQFATWNLLTGHFWRLGAFRDGLRFVESQLMNAMAMEDDWLVGALHFHKGSILLELGQHKAALAAHEISRSQLQRLAPEGPRLVQVEAWVGLEHALLGQFDLAKEHLDRAMEQADALDNDSDRVWPAIAFARAALLLGESDRSAVALERVERALGIAQRSTDYDNTEESLHAAARLRMEIGDLEGAHQNTRELARLLDYVPAHPAQQDYAYTHAQVLEALGRTEEAAAYLKRAYEWIMLVAGKMQDVELRRSWLEDARRNGEILAAAKKRGIG